MNPTKRKMRTRKESEFSNPQSVRHPSLRSQEGEALFAAVPGRHEAKSDGWPRGLTHDERRKQRESWRRKGQLCGLCQRLFVHEPGALCFHCEEHATAHSRKHRRLNLSFAAEEIAHLNTKHGNAIAWIKRMVQRECQPKNERKQKGARK